MTNERIQAEWVQVSIDDVEVKPAARIVRRRPPRRPNSLAREAEFQARVEELGGQVIEPKWLGVENRHRIRCPQGHEYAPRPKYVLKGGGICRICSGMDPGVAEASFRARIAEIGATVLEPIWLGVDRPHRVLCAAGHECSPRPSGVKQGEGICRTCVGRDPRAADAAFRARVEELGGVVIEPAWLGAMTPHRVRCAGGHEVMQRPNSIQQGRGLCRTCAGNDPKMSEATFRARVAELGGVVLEPNWLGVKTPHRVRCSAGHVTTPRPSALSEGGGICRRCMGRLWDAFYVLLNEEDQIVKFGITSGDPRPRIKVHARDGYSTEVRLVKDLPAGVARELEKTVIATLKLAGIQPVRGHEYFHASALPVIVDVFDNCPIPASMDLSSKELPDVNEAV